jgi:DMSO/TMAO reductase YedYZ molybdopterin-dependent catalytic subunit
MIFSRRDAIRVSGVAAAGLSLGALKPGSLTSQAAPPQEFPATLVEGPAPRDWAPLPLNADGSAVEYPDSAAEATIAGAPKWKPVGGVMPPMTGPTRETDYTKMKVRFNPGSVAKMRGTVVWSDLEKLPRISKTYLLQCGTPTPKGIVKWTGVRFSDFANMVGMIPAAHYARFVSVDGHYGDEEIRTLMHPQVMLAFMMNDKPIPPEFGAPLRLVIPFRYGNRSIKAVNQIFFATPSLPATVPAPIPG